MEQDYHYDSDSGNESSDVDVGLDFDSDGEGGIGPANRYIRDNEDLAYEILSTEDVSEHMLECIKEFNSVVKISHTTARLLLNHFRWDKEKLMERFFDSNQEKLFEEAQIASPYKKKDQMMSGLECGHRYCLSCWSEYISTKVVDEGTGQCITCAGYNCPVVVEDSQVMSLLKDPKVKLIYQHRISQSFVECNRQLRWCPFPDCKFVVKAPHADARRVQCKCQHVFCFSCGANWHDPVKCSLLKEWVKKCDDDSETSNWISANTKECPKCRVIIEKDGGCNHMVCKNVACKSEFCWVCLGPWEPHGSSWYSYKHVQFLQKAVDILCECRQTLMYTYVFAYYLQKNNQSAIFEDNQRDLEASTEKLSEYLERDITQANLADIKQKVQDKYRYCDQRRKKLLEHVHEGYDRDSWVYRTPC
ncbi:E3 ubiquitin-protein ligase arih1-like [Hyalella azteca]|uniref:RBR-type E3 ubiquitin transferase n=1 Tax=Hyalella azteca TaxID=294128 RepID=A0A979FM37_HYAAZ|nr:E3 ubiquitin-protein ligase arih1-like [Hyalella azteca]